MARRGRDREAPTRPNGATAHRLATGFSAGVLAAAVLLVTAAIPVVVRAHAAPVRVYPGHTAVLNAPPDRVEIETSQDIVRADGANAITVTGPTGLAATDGEAAVDPANRRLLSVALKPDLPPGEYTITWVTLSAEDDEEATGTFTFAVDPAATPRDGRTQLVAPTPAPGATGDGGDGATGTVVMLAAVLVALAAIGGFGWFILRPQRS